MGLHSQGQQGSTAPCVHERGRRKKGRYSELLRGDRSRLVVVARGTGRLSEEALQFVESLAAAKARDAPHAMFHSAAQAWRRRALSILRPLFCKFVGGIAHCVACPWPLAWRIFLLSEGKFGLQIRILQCVCVQKKVLLLTFRLQCGDQTHPAMCLWSLQTSS